MRLTFLERLATAHVWRLVAGILLVAVAMATALGFMEPWRLDAASKIVDAVVKFMVAAIGGVWALNRYFAGRTDQLQFRVEPSVEYVEGSAFGGARSTGLMLCRLVLVNTGRTLIAPLQHFVEIASVTPTPSDVRHHVFWRWPQEGTHPGLPIEPGSWAAVSFEVPIAAEVRVVWVYIEFQSAGKRVVNWHQSFALKGPRDAAPCDE